MKRKRTKIEAVKYNLAQNFQIFPNNLKLKRREKMR
jgi:hypothetical protein